MDNLLLCVRYILVIVCLEVVISHGDSCECDAISLIFSKEIFSLKVENVKLNSRIETIEAMLRERKEMQPSLTGKDAAQVRLLDEEQARLEPNLERKDLNNLLRKAFSAEKKERRRSDLKIEEGLGRLNRSLKEFDEQAKALIVSHENTLSRVIQEFKNKSAEIGANIRKDVLSVVEKLENQTDDLVNSRTTLERAIEDISQNVSRMDADMNSVIDIVLLDQRAECEPNCTNGGVCFMDGSCRCKPLTEGGHCERFICTDRCYENGGECEGPGLCKCPEGQNGYNCEHKDCVIPVNVAQNGSGRTYKIGEFLHVLCNTGYGMSSRSTDEVTCLTTGTWSGTVECVEIDECAPQPCIHGSCFDGIGEYTCSCFTGYSGQNCDTGCGETVSRAEESCGSVFRENHQRKLSLWVKSVMGFSSQLDTVKYSASRVIGCPDVYPGYSANAGDWSQATNSLKQKNHIEVEFDVKVNVISVDIYETYNAGAVTAISGLREDGIWQLLWSTDSPEVIESSRMFSPPLDVKDFSSLTKTLRIEVDNRASEDCVGIDAVRLHGCW